MCVTNCAATSLSLSAAAAATADLDATDCMKAATCNVCQPTNTVHGTVHGLCLYVIILEASRPTRAATDAIFTLVSCLYDLGTVLHSVSRQYVESII